MPNAWQSLPSPGSSSSSDSMDSPQESNDNTIGPANHDLTIASIPRRPTRSDNGSSTGSGSDGARSKERTKPLSRRGHFKSRLGCFNCKRRRVKCNEIRPACSPCCRLGLTCSYPTAALSSTGAAASSSLVSASSPSSSASVAVAPSAPLSMLAMEDLRFYHVFLTAAFPVVPLKSPEVWMQIGAMSHEYEHLAHAILGLGATHLYVRGNVDYNASALQHRVIAMKLANEQLGRPSTKVADNDALFATLVCLVTQSILMPTGLLDYVTIARGAMLLLTSVLPKYANSIFRRLFLENHLKGLLEFATEQPKDVGLLRNYQAAVMAMEPMCRTETEKTYQACLAKTIDSVFISAGQAWMDFITVFLMPCSFTHQEASRFLHPDNHIGYMLVIHAFLLDYLLARFCVAPSEAPKFLGRRTAVICWTRDVANKVPPTCRPLMKWALEFCNELEMGDGRYLLTP